MPINKGMLLVFLLFLSPFSAPSAQGQAEGHAARPSAAAADFDKAPVPLAQGAVVQPLCHPAYPGSCFQQWTAGSVPLKVSRPEEGDSPEIEYFLPSLAHVRNLLPSTSMEGWTHISRPSAGRSSKGGYYTHKGHPGVIRLVSAPKSEIKAIKEGSSVYVSEKDIELSPQAERALQRDLIKDSHEQVKRLIKRCDPSDQDSDSEAPRDAKAGAAEAPRDAKAGGGSKGKEQASAAEDPAPPPSSLKVRVTRDASAPVLTFDEKIKKAEKACVGGKPQADESSNDPIALCHECQANPHLQRVQKSLDKSAMDTLRMLLSAVRSGEAAKAFTDQVQYYDKTEKRSVRQNIRKWAQSGYYIRLDKKVEICEPDKALDQVIQNFRQTCKPPDFDRFFSQVYCQSCKKKIPPEIMLAMMTAESAGKCYAEQDNALESSVGLFQINAAEHQCEDNKLPRPGWKDLRDAARERQQALLTNNIECFFKMPNNIKAGVKILSRYYDNMNSQERPQEQGSCPSFSNMPAKERDSWRRAVSAYNGGPGWVNRAVQSIEGGQFVTEEKDGKTVRTFEAEAKGRSLKKDTKDLDFSHVETKAAGKAIIGRAARSHASWEELRMYYFMEKLLPCNKKKTGRQLSLTVSNLAHVEAILGRENSQDPSIVSYWERYIQQKRPKKCPGG